MSYSHRPGHTYCFTLSTAHIHIIHISNLEIRILRQTKVYIPSEIHPTGHPECFHAALLMHESPLNSNKQHN